MLRKKIIFSIDQWPQETKYPFGHLVGVFGEADDIETESKVILFEHSVETRNFSQQVLDCLPSAGVFFKLSIFRMIGVFHSKSTKEEKI